ncbi:MAG: MotA/TolQ/ExbB proton channel family protein [Halorhodospira sp.]
MSDTATLQPFAEGGIGQRLLAVLDNGGPVLILLALLSVFTLTLILLKLWQFAVARLYDRKTLEEALASWHAGETGQALQRLEASRYVGAEPLAAAMRGRLDAQLEEGRLREEVTRLASGRLEQLRAYLRGLEVIGMLSPLLGLLGTVLGMIEAFRQLEAAGSQVDPAMLSGGIWEALLTTAAGMALAIPAVAALTWLERVVERFRHRLEDAVTQVFTAPPPHHAA